MSLEHEKYVSLVTYRRSGEAVATAVWVAPVGDELGVITETDAGKVKRIRNNPRVSLSPCDMKGRVPADAATFQATARLVTGTEAVRVRSAIRRKYRTGYAAISLTWVLPELWSRLRGRRESKPEIAILISVSR